MEHKYYEEINAVYPHYCQWERVKARKEHEDEFGVIIKAGENYWRRQITPTWGNLFVLSDESFKKIHDIIFYNNIELKTAAKKILDHRFKATRTNNA
jgi:hypothetical protein